MSRAHRWDLYSGGCLCGSAWDRYENECAVTHTVTIEAPADCIATCPLVTWAKSSDRVLETV